MIEALGNGWETPEAAPDQTVNSAVQEAMYDGMFGVMQGTYTPEEALSNMDQAAANQQKNRILIKQDYRFGGCI